MRYQLYREQQLSCDITTTWEFFSTPENLAKITPKDLGFKVLTKDVGAEIYEGMKIDYTISPLFNIPMRWQTVITQVDKHKNFIDFQSKGPYRYWHHYHEFIQNKKGVLMKDTVDYDLSLDFLGTLAHRLMVKKKLNYIFDYRFRILEEKFNSTK